MTKYANQVKTAGRRMTKARQAVLRYLQNQEEPRTAAEISRGLNGLRVDLASVYRNVELLERLGVLMRSRQGNSAAYALSDRHHHHITCRSCRRRVCLPCEVSLPQPKGFRSVQHEVRLTGVCAACASV
ncbi:MAG: transcriptional repressor [Patescibacteria group bacterium]|nr:transcriptional repressor [Patescibacteria group bacterium]